MVLCVKKGKHDFKPLRMPFEVPWILPSKLRFKWRFSFDASCLYDPQEDKDLANDWNKGGGVTLSLFKNTRNAAMWAWRADFENGKIEVAPYFNKDNGIIFPDHDKILSFYPGQVGEVIVRREKSLWFVEVNHIIDEIRVSQSEKLKRPWFVRVLGAWFGGYDNDQNGLGGVAPQDMCFFSSFWI